MHSFVISTSDFKPPAVSPDVLIVTPEKSIGIEEVRLIQNFLSRKPMQTDKNQVYVLEAHLLTLTAQNALLKVLEEPPGTSEIYLVTDSPDLLLPTVLSRVQQTTPRSQSPATDTTRSEQLLQELKDSGANERLDLLDAQGFTRETFLDFLDGLEHILHHQLQKSKPTFTNYEAISETRKYLKANCSLKLCSAFFAVNLFSRAK